MYQNIFCDRKNDIVYLWDDEHGLGKIPMSEFRYAYRRKAGGEYKSLYGDELERITTYDVKDPTLFESAAATLGRRDRGFAFLLALTATLAHFTSVVLIALALRLTHFSKYELVNQWLLRSAGLLIATIGVWRLGRCLGGYGLNPQPDLAPGPNPPTGLPWASPRAWSLVGRPSSWSWWPRP